MRRIITKDLYQLLSIAQKESNYYQEKIKDLGKEDNYVYDNFTLIPELTRNDLCSNKDRILCSAYQNLRKKELDLILTSGSTGQFVEVYWDRADYLHSILTLWRKRINWYGIHPYHLRAEFSLMTTTGSTRPSSEKIRKSGNVLELSMVYMDEISLMQYYKALKTYEVVWIYSTVGALLLFTQFCRNNNLPRIQSLKYIELYGECVSPGSLELLKQYYCVPVSVMYGAKEVNGIALSCPEGHMHVLEDNVFVEKQHDSILITSLKNHAFPIIRYRIGDIFELEQCNCKYGEGSIITNFIGREKQLAFIDEKSGITIKALTSIVYSINALFQYCFLQYNIGYRNNHFVITIVLPAEKNTWANQIRNEINTYINQIAPNNSIHVSLTNVPLSVNTRTGKTDIVSISDSNMLEIQTNKGRCYKSNIYPE